MKILFLLPDSWKRKCPPLLSSEWLNNNCQLLKNLKSPLFIKLPSNPIAIQKSKLKKNISTFNLLLLLKILSNLKKRLVSATARRPNAWNYIVIASPLVNSVVLNAIAVDAVILFKIRQWETRLFNLCLIKTPLPLTISMKLNLKKFSNWAWKHKRSLLQRKDAIAEDQDAKRNIANAIKMVYSVASTANAVAAKIVISLRIITKVHIRIQPHLNSFHRLWLLQLLEPYLILK